MDITPAPQPPAPPQVTVRRFPGILIALGILLAGAGALFLWWPELRQPAASPSPAATPTVAPLPDTTRIVYAHTEKIGEDWSQGYQHISYRTTVYAAHMDGSAPQQILSFAHPAKSASSIVSEPVPNQLHVFRYRGETDEAYFDLTGNEIGGSLDAQPRLIMHPGFRLVAVQNYEDGFTLRDVTTGRDHVYAPAEYRKVYAGPGGLIDIIDNDHLLFGYGDAGGVGTLLVRVNTDDWSLSAVATKSWGYPQYWTFTGPGLVLGSEASGSFGSDAPLQPPSRILLERIPTRSVEVATRSEDLALQHIALSPDRTRAVFAAVEPAAFIATVSRDGIRGLRRIALPFPLSYRSDWSDDGRSLIAVHETDGRIMQIDADTGIARQLGVLPFEKPGPQGFWEFLGVFMPPDAPGN